MRAGSSTASRVHDRLAILARDLDDHGSRHALRVLDGNLDPEDVVVSDQLPERFPVLIADLGDLDERVRVDSGCLVAGSHLHRAGSVEEVHRAVQREDSGRPGRVHAHDELRALDRGHAGQRLHLEATLLLLPRDARPQLPELELERLGERAAVAVRAHLEGRVGVEPHERAVVREADRGARVGRRHDQVAAGEPLAQLRLQEDVRAARHHHLLVQQQPVHQRHAVVLAGGRGREQQRDCREKRREPGRHCRCLGSHGWSPQRTVTEGTARSPARMCTGAAPPGSRRRGAGRPR